MKRAVIAISCFFITLFVLVIGWWLGRVTARAEPPAFTVRTDTITDWQHDTVFCVEKRVVKLPVHDTIRMTDSLWLTDSVLVEVPISRYRYDTTLTDTNGATRLRAVLSGYCVSVDTLTVNSSVRPVMVEKATPWYRRFGPSVGVGVGSNGKGDVTFGVFVGVGYLF